MQALGTKRAAVAGRQGPGAVAARVPRVQRASQVVRVAEIVGDDMWEAEVLKADKPVLVDFWATWCGPCKLVAPLMDWAEKEYGGAFKVVKVNHTPNPNIIAKYKVYGLPTLMVFKDGALVADSHREGAVTKAILQKYIEEHIIAQVGAS